VGIMKLRPGLSVAMFVTAITFALALCAAPPFALAQDNPDVMGEGGGSMMMPTPAPADSDNTLPPLPGVRVMQPISGSMMVAPPYATAPARVGFFVLADDPENVGFLTYQWNFGDGTVSSLPPELYIFHTYQNPGNYVCSLVIKTVDGRSKSFFQGILVKPAQD
jgi:PKD domain